MKHRVQIDIRDRSLSVYAVDGKGDESHVKTVVATADTPVMSYVIESPKRARKAKPKITVTNAPKRKAAPRKGGLGG